jgi:hypothetical protein
MAVMAFSSICLPSVACAANTAWEKYLNFPSAENARLVHKMTYSSHKDNAEEVAAGDLAILRIQVVAGDRAAFGLAYLLMRSSDGGVLEDLQAILASAIRSHPLVFLEEVDRLNIPEKTLESVLLMPGLEYVDRPLAQKYELQMRRNAIGAIARNNLSPIRNKCVAIYDKELRKEG